MHASANTSLHRMHGMACLGMYVMNECCAHLNVGIGVLQGTMVLGGQANEGCIGLCISIFKHCLICGEYFGVRPLFLVLT